MRQDPQLVRGVYRIQPYWGWKSALADAGIEYSEIRVEIRERVKCQICGKYFKLLGSHLVKRHEITSDEYREQFPQAELSSEHLREQQTGRTYVPPHPDFIAHWEPIYTPEYVLDRLHEYAQQGFSMEYANIATVDFALVEAVKKFLDCDWDSAIRRIGLDPTEFRGLVRDSDYTLDDFRRWLEDRERQGLGCTNAVLIQEYDQWRRRPRMYVWALRLYGNWREALLAAKVDMKKPIFGGHHFLTAKHVSDEIKRMKEAGEDLSHTAVALLPYGGQLTSAAERFFGSWTRALNSARVPKALRTRTTNYDSKEEVLKAIEYRIEHDYALEPVEVYGGFRSDVALLKRTCELFGSWHKGVAEAGGSPAQQQEAIDRLFPTKAEIVSELQRRHAAGQKLTKGELRRTDVDKHLYVMAIGYFGTWHGAVRAAGVDPKQYHQWNLKSPAKYPSELDVLAEIRRRQQEEMPLNARGLTHGEHKDVPLITAARKFYSSWQEAITAAGIDYESVTRKKQDYSLMEDKEYRSYASRQAVIEGIQNRLKKGLPLSHRLLTHGPHETRDNALLAAAIKLFKGDWDKALVAAGVDLQEVQKKWVRRKKIREKREQRKLNTKANKESRGQT